MFIQTEATPNPATLKFIPGRVVLDGGTMEFTTREVAKRSPLAERLFAVAGVTSVFYGSDFVTVTKDADRILPIDRAVAEHWGDLMVQSRSSGVALSVMDGFFAATALAKGLTLVTRNVKDFSPFGVPLLNPWDQ